MKLRGKLKFIVRKKITRVIGLILIASILFGAVAFGVLQIRNHFKAEKVTVDGKALVESGSEALNNGDIPSAIKNLEQAVQADPENIDARKKLSNAYFLDKQYDQSVDQMKAVSEKTPEDDYVYNALGNTYNQEGKYDEAIEAYKKAVERGNLDSIGNLITLYNSLERYQESLDVLNPLLERNPDDKFLNQLLASTYYKKGEVARANQILAQHGIK